MRCLIRPLVILALVGIAAYVFLRPAPKPHHPKAADSASSPFVAGEKIVFAVKMGPIKMGTSTLTYVGKSNLEGREAEEIIFETTGFNFYDRERILAEPETFYPIRVERTVNIWGKKMQITEEYSENSWRLNKKEGGKVTQQTFNNTGRVQNFISVVYFYRRIAELRAGSEWNFNFIAPVKMRLKGIVDFPLADKIYKAYYLESVPVKYQVWLDSNEKRLPLRIDGSLAGFSSLALIMREHN
ncbi:MAG: hypothetical protein ACOY3D_03470 [Candidatus Omnitrophota bacterium]